MFLTILLRFWKECSFIFYLPLSLQLPAMASTLLLSALLLSTLSAAAPRPGLLTALTSDLSPTRDDSLFTLYDLPDPLSGPCDLCTGPDGALWGQDQLSPTLFRIDPVTNRTQTFEIPFTLDPILNATLPPLLSSVAGLTAFSCAIRPGRDGNIYAAFGTRNQLVRINPTTKRIDLFTPDNLLQPLGDLQPFNDLYSAKDGIYFSQTSANLLSFFSFATQEIESYLIPTPASFPLGVFVDSDGFVWFTELVGQKIGRFDPRTKTFKEFPVPLSLVTPAVIRVETEGRYIWFTSFVGNAMGRLDKRTGGFQAYPNPLAGGLVAEDTLDSDGNIWFSSATQNVVSMLDPRTGSIEQVVMPGTSVVAPVSVPLYFVIAMNYGPGDAVWFTEETVGRVGRFDIGRYKEKKSGLRKEGR